MVGASHAASAHFSEEVHRLTSNSSEDELVCRRQAIVTRSPDEARTYRWLPPLYQDDGGACLEAARARIHANDATPSPSEHTTSTSSCSCLVGDEDDRDSPVHRGRSMDETPSQTRVKKILNLDALDLSAPVSPGADEVVRTPSADLFKRCVSSLSIPKSPFHGERVHGGVTRTASVGASGTSPPCSSAPSHSGTGGGLLDSAAPWWQANRPAGGKGSLAWALRRVEDRGLLLDWRDVPLTDQPVLGRGTTGVIRASVLSGREGGPKKQAVALKMMAAVSPALGVRECDLEADAVNSMMAGVRLGAHPNVIEFVGAALHPMQGPVLVYELVDGVNLEDYMQMKWAREKSSKLRLEVALSLGQQMFHALDWLHTSGSPLVHRDVKPSNLMLCGEDMAHIKLIDFGLARDVSGGGWWEAAGPVLPAEEDARAGGDMTGKTGTYRYMAPEVWGGTTYGCKADVYSATMVLHYLVTGNVPFARMPPVTIAQLAAEQLLRPDTTKVAAKNPEVADLFQSGWAASPQDRPSSRHMVDCIQCIQFDIATAPAKSFGEKLMGLRRKRSPARVQPSASAKSLPRAGSWQDLKGALRALTRGRSHETLPGYEQHQSPRPGAVLATSSSTASMASTDSTVAQLSTQSESGSERAAHPLDLPPALGARSISD